MHRKVLVGALLLAACGVDPSEDDRPRTFEYITSVVLKPSCGGATCHSSFHKASDRAYDTVVAACESIVTQTDVIPGDPDGSFIHQVLVRTIDRMPYDQPMPESDRLLLRDWISLGAPGLPDPLTATAEDCK